MIHLPGMRHEAEDILDSLKALLPELHVDGSIQLNHLLCHRVVQVVGGGSSGVLESLQTLVTEFTSCLSECCS
jgi:hypothetical protein